MSDRLLSGGVADFKQLYSCLQIFIPWLQISTIPFFLCAVLQLIPLSSEALKGVVVRMGVKRPHLDWATPRVPAYRAARKAGIPHLADFLWMQWKQFYAEFPEEVDVRSLEGHMQSRVNGMQMLDTIMSVACLRSYFRYTPDVTLTLSSSTKPSSATSSVNDSSATSSVKDSSATSKDSTAPSVKRQVLLPPRFCLPVPTSKELVRPTLRPAQFNDVRAQDAVAVRAAEQAAKAPPLKIASLPRLTSDRPAVSSETNTTRSSLTRKPAIADLRKCLVDLDQPTPSSEIDIHSRNAIIDDLGDISIAEPNGLAPSSRINILSQKLTVDNLTKLPVVDLASPIHSQLTESHPLASPFSSPVRNKLTPFSSPLSPLSPLSSPVVTNSPRLSTVPSSSEETGEQVPTIDSSATLRSSAAPPNHVMVTRYRGKSSGASSNRNRHQLTLEAIKRKKDADDTIVARTSFLIVFVFLALYMPWRAYRDVANVISRIVFFRVIRLRRERSRVRWLCNTFLTPSTMSEKAVSSSSTEPDALCEPDALTSVDQNSGALDPAVSVPTDKGLDDADLGDQNSGALDTAGFIWPDIDNIEDLDDFNLRGRHPPCHPGLPLLV
ncbi:hypothetical protein BDZ89DRAFT_1045216 [Hymenopellis radicata]|nr:hypothetical protein BDZ89DRAFT_1045216 [Hymenopellis radicata]